jgi:predicted nucleic acid-binding protein
MKFWDSSAIVPLLITEKSTIRMASLQDEDPAIVTWWGSGIECASALARHERLSTVNQNQIADGFQRLSELQKDWEEIQPAEVVRDLAIRLLRVHALQAADSLQLAAAIVASENRPAMLAFVCLDERLAAAARREGFRVVAA